MAGSNANVFDTEILLLQVKKLNLLFLLRLKIILIIICI